MSISVCMYVPRYDSQIFGSKIKKIFWAYILHTGDNFEPPTQIKVPSPLVGVKTNSIFFSFQKRVLQENNTKKGYKNHSPMVMEQVYKAGNSGFKAKTASSFSHFLTFFISSLVLFYPSILSSPLPPLYPFPFFMPA